MTLDYKQNNKSNFLKVNQVGSFVPEFKNDQNNLENFRISYFEGYGVLLTQITLDGNIHAPIRQVCVMQCEQLELLFLDSSQSFR